MSRLFRLQGTVALLLILGSCRKKQVAIPVPPPAAATQPHGAGQGAAPSTESSTPQLAAPKPTSTNTPANPYQVNKQPQPASSAPGKSSRPSAISNASPSAQPSAGAPAPAAAPVPPPQLVDIVPPNEQRQLNAAIDQSLLRARASLAGIANRELSKDQQALIDQIRNIMQQAEASRKSDLPGAKSLAERAEVLAKDLAGSFH